MDIQRELLVTRADRVLVWLKILTIFLGGVATLAVVFLSDVMMARLANPVGVAGVEPVPMSEVEELHHWIGYKVALGAMDDKHVVYHVEKAFSLATETKHKSALDGILAEHMPAGHFVHTKNILKELLGKPEPPFSPIQLDARLALLLLKENKIGQSRKQVEHMQKVATETEKEVIQKALKAIQKGGLEQAGRLLAELSGGQ